MKAVVIVCLLVAGVACAELAEPSHPAGDRAEEKRIELDGVEPSLATEADMDRLNELVSALSVPDPRFRLMLDLGWTTGRSSWEISFQEFEPGFGIVDVHSRLGWKRLESIIYRLHGEYKVNDWLRLSASVGLGSLDNGQNSDTDWYANFMGRDFIFSKSEADTDGDVTLFNLNAHVRLNEFFELSRLPGQWDVFGGYQYHEEDLRDRNGVQTIIDEEQVNMPFSGLNSTYLFEWQAARLGVRGEIPLADRLRLRGSLAGLWARFEGEGFWNLRDDFRNESPNFVQSASNGLGVELSLFGVFDITETFFAEIGWWQLYLKAQNGTDKLYFADGFEARTDLEFARTQRQGVFIGFGGQF